jgi:hypothetical protein
VDIHFHHIQGRILKEAALTLAPGTAGFLDFRTAEVGLTARRGEMVPCLKVGSGAVVSSFELVDTLTGLDIAITNEAVVVAGGGG